MNRGLRLLDYEQAGAGLLKHGHNEAERAERAIGHIEGVEGQFLLCTPLLRETHGQFVAVFLGGNGIGGRDNGFEDAVDLGLGRAGTFAA